MTDPPSPAVRLSGVTIRYGERVALAGVDLEVRPGEFVALAGPNGSGKTTLLRALLGFLSPDAGVVEVLGGEPRSVSVRERARRVAWVPQEEGARDDVPLLDYLLYGRYAQLRPLEGETDEDRSRAMGVLAEVGLADRAEDGILSLSGGERQRAILGRALVQASPVLLLDEPTAHLDIGHQLDLLGRVRSLAAVGRVTVIAALHDLNLAARFADRIVVLSRGRKVADGPPASVLSEELLERVWGVVAELRRDRRTGASYLLPYRPATPAPQGPTSLGPGPVHVVGGGGTASPLLRALAEQGYRLTAGVLNLLDSDHETAQELGVPCTVEVPFAPIGPEARARLRGMLEAARAIVVAPFPVGPSNLSNLEDLQPFASRVLLLPRTKNDAWDFADGAATRALAALRSAGAVEAAGPDGWRTALNDRLDLAPKPA
ncbi:MAG TPA: ABC transporter ATP-binding protein [Thermoplasmata archaeon]|nr:ABC transporter ATP-binding protein [Thermoplasmata archaeon]